ncbi:MAG: C-terminal target protein, partial [Bacteroidota bacterium]|nr:C-terminal target protein [Bacteroidota bacterium]
MKKVFLLLPALFLMLHSFCAVPIVYVTPTGAGAFNGTSWANALKGSDLKNFLDTVSTLKQVWVAKGTYYPGNSGDVNNSFLVKTGIQLYGGFVGTETVLTQRNQFTNLTILSGDLDQSGGKSGNDAYHVVVSSNTANGTAIINGFTITGGNAAGGNHQAGGMDVYGSPTITNCRFVNNYGGYYGGGIYVESGSISNINGCLFNSNTTDYGASAVYVDNCNPTFTNSVFSGNTTTFGGDVLDMQSSAQPVFTNCAFAGNDNGGQGTLRFSNGSGAVITNCIIWNNGNNNNIDNAFGSAGPITVTYSDIQGGYGGSGNQDIDPEYINGITLQLSACSPVIDSGTASGTPISDYFGNPRLYGGGVDMGAYERQSAPSPAGTCAGPVLYVNLNATGANDGSSWSDAFTDLTSGIAAGASGTSVWVAKGTYYPGA